MDLKDFVSNSLTQICEAIQDAQTRVGQTGAWISPVVSTGLPASPDGPRVIPTAQGRGYVHDVKFDVAVTASDEQQAQAGAGLKVLGVSLGADGHVNYVNSAVSRIQFSVPIVWPGQTQPELEKMIEQKRREVQEANDARARSLGHGGPNSWMTR